MTKRKYTQASRLSRLHPAPPTARAPKGKLAARSQRSRPFPSEYVALFEEDRHPVDDIIARVPQVARLGRKLRRLAQVLAIPRIRRVGFHRLRRSASRSTCASRRALLRRWIRIRPSGWLRGIARLHPPSSRRSRRSSPCSIRTHGCCHLETSESPDIRGPARPRPGTGA